MIIPYYAVSLKVTESKPWIMKYESKVRAMWYLCVRACIKMDVCEIVSARIDVDSAERNYES